ncbi:MAG: glycosyltransferase family 39 protein, partial [Cyanobacteriota bacterium]|nr:glycosyltransferase family 39 protein [Cyanobacteriota bacterium]
MKYREFYTTLFIPILFFVGTLLWMPVRTNFIFDTDEGQELIKALLYSQGFSLYTPIWSDQPPLLTIFLVRWFEGFGQSVFSARLLVLCLSSLLVLCFFQTLKLNLGQLPASIGTLFLCLSGNFLRLSVSVMIGLPSLAFAMLAIYLLFRFVKHQKFAMLPISGAAMAISLQLKMFSVFLIPLQIIVLLFARSNPKSKFKLGVYQAAIAAFIWSGVVLLFFVAIGIACNSLDVNSFFQFHLESSLKNIFINENSWLDTLVLCLQDLDYFLFAILGIKVVVSKRDILQLFPLLWLGTAALILLNHKPIWYHHYLLLSLPAIWLASYGVAVAIPYFKGFKISQFNLVVGLCLLSAIAAPIKLGVMHWQNRLFLQESQAKIEMVERVLDYQQDTQWVFTDNPMYAFVARLPVPPEIAVLSRKRIASGEMTRDKLYALLAKYRPEQVILERFPEVYDPIRPYLDANYVKLSDRGSV